jgi:hypothetical protein
MSPTPHIVAVGLLTEQDLAKLGPNFNRLFPVDEAPHFAELLAAIDDADRQFQENRDNGYHSQAGRR